MSTERSHSKLRRVSHERLEDGASPRASHRRPRPDGGHYHGRVGGGAKPPWGAGVSLPRVRGGRRDASEGGATPKHSFKDRGAARAVLAATIIQACGRGWRERRFGYLACIRLVAPMVQRLWRGHAIRRVARRAAAQRKEVLRCAATLIQSRERARRMRLTLLETSEVFRAHYVSDKLGEIETSLSGFDAMRERLKDECARAIQRAWRRYILLGKWIKAANALTKLLKVAAERHRERKESKAARQKKRAEQRAAERAERQRLAERAERPTVAARRISVGGMGDRRAVSVRRTSAMQELPEGMHFAMPVSAR